jgi:hypothetical protein
MTNLKIINEAVKSKIPLRIAEENLKLEKEQQETEQEFKDLLNDLGIPFLK